MAKGKKQDFRVAVDIDGERRFLYEPQPKQILLHASKAPNVLFGGAAGGAKSHALRWHGILACLAVPNLRVLLLRRKFTELESTHLLSLRLEVPPEVAQINESKHRLVFPNGSILQFGHCNTDKDFQSYLSTEWALILIDEAGQFTPWQLTMLPSRLRTTNPHVTPQFALASNPGGPGHLWLLSHFVEKSVDQYEEPGYDPDQFEFIQSLVTDNRYINKEYVDRLQRLPEAERKAYLEGDWYSFVGQVFTEWRPAYHIERKFKPPYGWRYAGGMDWGMRNPGCFVLFALGQEGDVVGFKELYFKEKTAFDVGRAVGLMCQNHNVEYIAADEQMWYNVGSSAPNLAEECQNGIFSVYGKSPESIMAAPKLIQATHGRGSRAAKLQVFHRYLSWELDEQGELKQWRRPMLRFTEDCKHCIRTIPMLPHDLDKPEDVDTDAEDHCYDAVSAFLMSRPPPAEYVRAPLEQDQHPGFDAVLKKRRDKVQPWEQAIDRAPATTGYVPSKPMVELDDW